MAEIAPTPGLITRRRALFAAGVAGAAGVLYVAYGDRLSGGSILGDLQQDTGDRPVGPGGQGGGLSQKVAPEIYAARFANALKQPNDHPELLKTIGAALGSIVLLDSTHHRLTPVGGLFVSKGLNRKVMAGVTPIVQTKTGTSAAIRTEPFTRFGFNAKTDPRFPGAQIYYGDKDPVVGALLSVDTSLGVMVNVDLTTANPANPYSSGGLQAVEGGFELAASVAESIYKTIK